MAALNFRPSAPTLLLGIGLAILFTFLLAFFIDEEELFLCFFLVISAAYWFLLRDAPIRSRLIALTSPALYLLGYLYAVQASDYSLPGESLQPLMLPYYATFIVAIVVAFYTMIKVQPSTPHLLHVIFVPCGFMFFFYGSMELLHDWL